MPLPGEPQPRLQRYLWPLWWVLMFVLTHLPKIPGPPIEVDHVDKVFHFLMYFILTVLGGKALIRAGRVKAFSTLVKWAAVYLIYAAVDEWLQRFVHRTPSLQDWLADAAGIFAATLIVSNFQKEERGHH